MRLPDTRTRAVPFSGRRLLTIVCAGVAGAAIVLAVGFVAELLVIGRDEAAARQRVEADVRESFGVMARSLRGMTTPLVDADALLDGARDDDAATRRLFDAAGKALDAAEGDDLAITVYAGDGRPIAWAGRPSDLPADRLQGPEAWFVAQGALGLRLVYVVPVSKAGARVGAVASERALSPTPASDRDADAPFVVQSRLTPVSIELSFENARTQPETGEFDVQTPKGDRLLTAAVSGSDLARTRQRWRRAVESLALMAVGLACLLLCSPLLDWRNSATRASQYRLAFLATAAALVISRLILRFASPADWSDAVIFSGTAYASAVLPPLLTSPFDFLLTALLAGCMVGLSLFGVEAWRLSARRARRPLSTPGRTAVFAGEQLLAGAFVAGTLVAHLAFIDDVIGNTGVDLLHFSLHPLDAARLALQVGLIVFHASVIGLGILICRAAAAPWRLPWRSWRWGAASSVLWALPLVAWMATGAGGVERTAALLVPLATVIVLAGTATRLKARYHHGSQAFRLTLLTVGLIVPALALYPAVFQLGWKAKAQLVETRYAPQALKQRQTIQDLLKQSLGQIDSFPGLADLVTSLPVPADIEALTDRAFQVWKLTGLAGYPVTSSVELYGPDGRLVSRFAFNLPDDLAAVPRSVERTCNWETFEEVSPFFAEERRVLHAGRAVCAPNGNGVPGPVGSIVVHAMLDYANLPFISSQSPYVELLRPSDPLRDEGISGRDVEYAVYGWSRRPLYASRNRAWVLTDDVFERVESSRDAVWAHLQRGDERFDVYLLNDRGGIYALGFPRISALGHLVNLAEIAVLAAGTYLFLLVLNAAFSAFTPRGAGAPALLREIRASFYRKLFLAFVAATVVPVLALALVTGNYIAAEINADVEQEAVRTAASARRVVEDLAVPRAQQQGTRVDDNLMVWVSRLIDQDVNIFRGARLQATSERNLFASGLLPTRTPAAVYRALELRNEAATVTNEQVGMMPYLVAATSTADRQGRTILTVPLTSRQQEIEDQIDALDRQILLGALLFILAGAGIGYSMAERIADPVNRLTRATQRIARGDLDARIASTSSDELRRLVEAFNRMAADLQRQRQELERTHRLEAWAEMARQVAHDIKNPLTPIQLNAEHLRRVHADRGEPLSPVLEECVGNILIQVKLLRQIASEFSNFASSPTARPAAVNVGGLLQEIIGPYRTGLSERIVFDVRVPAGLPEVWIDRALISRALTNIIENALGAMSGTGTLTVAAWSEDQAVRIRISDTGIGMDTEALARAFEPYFSTKASGTGLGLPIAKRNVELSGGTIAIESRRGTGTTVELSLPRNAP